MNLGFIPFIDMYSDPDAVNQLIIKMVIQSRKRRVHRPLVLVSTNSIDHRQFPSGRSNDRLESGVEHFGRSTGRGNESMAFERHRRREWSVDKHTHVSLLHAVRSVPDADIRATLNSYQYLKKVLTEKLEAQVRVEPMAFVSPCTSLRSMQRASFAQDEDEAPSKTAYRELSMIELMNNCNGLEYFLSNDSNVERRRRDRAFRFSGIDRSKGLRELLPERRSNLTSVTSVSISLSRLGLSICSDLCSTTEHQRHP